MSAVRRYSLRCADSPDVLLRVLSLCQRRRCEVVALDYVRCDAHRPGRLLLTVRAGERHGSRLAQWLAGLVFVEAVWSIDEGGAAGGAAEPRRADTAVAPRGTLA